MDRKKPFVISKMFPWDLRQYLVSMLYSGGRAGGFQYNQETNELALIISEMNVTGKDKKAIKEGEIDLRIYQVEDNMLPLITFGESPCNFLIDLPFFPTEYNSELDFNCLSNKLHIVYVNPVTNLVEIAREMEMTPRVRKRLVNAWNKNIRNEFFLGTVTCPST